MERAAVLADSTALGLAAVSDLLPSDESLPEDGTLDLATAVGHTERKTILRALDAAHDSKPAAAELLGIAERTLWTKLKKYGL